MIVLGIDPGARSAAFAFIKAHGWGSLTACVGDVPTANGMVDAAAFARLIRDHGPAVAIIETVGARPLEGRASIFRFGMGTGLLRGVVLGSGVRLVEVTPAKWKRHYRLSADKEQARARAINLFPKVENLTHKKDAGRAEALLLANYYIEALLDPV